MDAISAMETCRAMRWLKPDPVPEELIRKVIHAATVRAGTSSSCETPSSASASASCSAPK